MIGKNTIFLFERQVKFGLSYLDSDKNVCNRWIDDWGVYRQFAVNWRSLFFLTSVFHEYEQRFTGA